MMVPTIIQSALNIINSGNSLWCRSYDYSHLTAEAKEDR